MTIEQTLKKAVQKVDHIDAELLLAHTLRTTREYIISHRERRLSLFEYVKFYANVRKRAHHTPLAYITGSKYFFGYEFKVNKHTLVPRPDTEVLVEHALSILEEKISKSDKKIILIDIGTGSGCILIAIIKLLAEKNLSTRVECFASDISSQALEVAKYNAEKLNTTIIFKKGNLFEPFLAMDFSDTKLIITANLPYLTQAQFDEEASIQKEPHSALVADEYGFALYKQLFEQIKNAGLADAILLCEIDPAQKDLCIKTAPMILEAASVLIEKDYSGNDRVAVISF